MIDEAVKLLLEQIAGVNAYPSTSATRLADVPRLVYSVIDAPRGYTDSGVAGVIPGRYQVDAFAATATAARALLAKLQARTDAATPGLDGYAGTVASTTILRIHFPEDPRQAPVALAREGSETTTAHLMMDMRIDYRP